MLLLSPSTAVVSVNCRLQASSLQKLMIEICKSINHFSPSLVWEFHEKKCVDFNPRVGIIKDEQGNNFTEKRYIKNRWKEYVENLYMRNNQIKDTFTKSIPLENEPNILEEEIG